MGQHREALTARRLQNPSPSGFTTMADCDIPKPVLLEFDKAEFSPAKKTPTKGHAVHERLVNSPKKPLSLDQIRDRQEKAEEARQQHQEKKVETAHAVSERVNQVRGKGKNLLSQEGCSETRVES